MTIVFEGMFFFITAQVTKILKHKSYSEDDSVVCLWDMYSWIVCDLALPDNEWVLFNPEWAIITCVCRDVDKEHSVKWWLCPFYVLRTKIVCTNSEY